MDVGSDSLGRGDIAKNDYGFPTVVQFNHQAYKLVHLLGKYM